MFREAIRYWQTLRHLKPTQFTGRLRFRLARPRPDLRAAPALRSMNGIWKAPARRRPSLLGEGRFHLLNQSAGLAEIGWDNPALDKLWRYNQHYFDDLNAEEAEARRDWHVRLLADWCAGNDPGWGSGWEPYPTSLRIVNWIKWTLAGAALSPEWTHSLAVQTRWLMRRLEWHLLGNHLFANAKALVFAGLFFDGEEARHWLETGLGILAREIPEQILADGGQFELSPMYHALALEDLLDLVNILRAYPAGDAPRSALLQACEARIPAMQRWLRAMCHLDGEISFFNDAATGIAPAPGELAAYALRLGFEVPPDPAGSVWLSDSGYARLAQGDAVLIADMARIGPDYLPGHAHADTLSFELSFRGQRIFVNGGTSVYGNGPERLRQRGTAAHNSVVVAGANSSDVWSGFRVGRRAYPIAPDVAGMVARAGHDGYRHLPGRPVHDRCWTLAADRLVVEDGLSVSGLAAEARYHLHPAVHVRQDGDDHGVLLCPDGTELGWRTPGGAAALQPSSWHPEFGVELPSTCIALPLRDGRATFELSWT